VNSYCQGSSLLLEVDCCLRYNTPDMSGHSKWSTIKRQKNANDQARGKLFSKLAKAISVAVKTGGGPNPDSNYKLKMAVEQAKSSNMPKENIDRAIQRASGSDTNLQEVTYEGFGPFGVGLIIEAATDNKNRTGQEVKNLLERSGGSMGGPGSVAFNFDSRGLIVIKKKADAEAQMLGLIDLGIEDFEETDDAIEAYVNSVDLMDTAKKLTERGEDVVESKLIQKPKNLINLESAEKSDKLIKLLDNLDELEDVQNVFMNADF